MKRRKLSDQIVAYITKQHPLDFFYLSVNEIAKHFQISLNHLTSIFIEDKGMSLPEFLLREKLKRSKYLLIHNNQLTIKDIAIALGFRSSNYFIQEFKKHVGVTPGKFRQINQELSRLNDRRVGKKDRRCGLQDRRMGVDRRKNKLFQHMERSNLILRNEDRRQGLSDRRIGPEDRRLIH